jgi:hypothetical protein
MDRLELILQRADLVLEFQDPLDPGEVDALVLGQALDLAQLGDVARTVTAAAAGRSARGDEADAVVLAQGLRVHPGELCGDRDDEHRRTLVDPVTPGIRSQRLHLLDAWHYRIQPSRRRVAGTGAAPIRRCGPGPAQR